MTKYVPDVKKIFAHWQGQKIVVHREKSKSKTQGVLLIRKYLKKGFAADEIIRRINIYSKIYHSKNLLFPFQKSPYKVGLNEFFEYTEYTQEMINRSYSKIIKHSWFYECEEDVIKKWTKK